MDSKAEILSKYVDKQMDGISSELKFISIVHFPTVAVVEAMDEYAKQVAIDFAEFIKDNSYTKSDKGWYQYHVQIESKYNFSLSQTVYNFITIEEIFELYLQSKQ